MSRMSSSLSQNDPVSTNPVTQTAPEAKEVQKKEKRRKKNKEVKLETDESGDHKYTLELWNWEKKMKKKR